MHNTILLCINSQWDTMQHGGHHSYRVGNRLSMHNETFPSLNMEAGNFQFPRFRKCTCHMGFRIVKCYLKYHGPEIAGNLSQNVT
jgi:hypothetical protein